MLKISMDILRIVGKEAAKAAAKIVIWLVDKMDGK